MVYCKTGRGTEVALCFNNDCCENEGGFWVEVYLDEYGDRFDDFCIHTDDCDCNDRLAVEQFAIDYVANIFDY